MKHMLENTLQEPTWCTPATDGYLVHATLQIARHFHRAVSEGHNFRLSIGKNQAFNMN